MSEVGSFRGAAHLVVGGAGFVGSALVRRLLDHGAEHVEVVDNLLSAERDNLPMDERLTFVEASINEPAVLEGLRDRFDYVFHLATFHGNQNSIADPLADHEHNSITTLNLCHALRGDDRVRRLVYASAGCTVAEKTYGDAEATTEDDPVSLYLDSPYQISKILGEMYLNFYEMQHGLRAVKARFQNVYGPGEVLGAGRWRGTEATIWRNVVPTFIYRGLKGMPLTLHNGGAASRDFIYVEDIVAGLVLCAARGAAGGVYNLASGVETTILELAEVIVELTGSRSELEVAPRRTWDRSGHRFGSTEKADRDLGFRAETKLRDGLAATVAWTEANLARIEAAVSRHVEHASGAS